MKTSVEQPERHEPPPAQIRSSEPESGLMDGTDVAGDKAPAASVGMRERSQEFEKVWLPHIQAAHDRGDAEFEIDFGDPQVKVTRDNFTTASAVLGKLGYRFTQIPVGGEKPQLLIRIRFA